ncbi:hypothetical protein ACCO45_008142 [Purpureocillium lilacinum]|uniref:Uncharacterized protein n=1 Tax=Purpureocillium lilacinum TaxID=33203 RepID=A0ACC4DNX3_PURLI
MNGWDQSPQSVSPLGPLPLDGRAGCRMSQHGADELVLRRDLGVGLSGRMSLARALSGDETSLALHCMAPATAPEKMARRPHEKDPRLARKRYGDQGLYGIAKRLRPKFSLVALGVLLPSLEEAPMHETQRSAAQTESRRRGGTELSSRSGQKSDREGVGMGMGGRTENRRMRAPRFLVGLTRRWSIRGDPPAHDGKRTAGGKQPIGAAHD